MLFNSIQFLLFFPAVLLVNYLLPFRVRYLWLLGCSYYFYMCWNPRYALLMALSTAITYASGLLIAGAHTSAHKHLWVVLSLCSNLAILFYFKYANFALRSLSAVLQAVHISLNIPQLDVLLPVGISFYTFQALGYTLDVARGTVEPERNPARYALFVSFFPQLVAGPIERSGNLIHQLRERHEFDFARAKSGVLRMLWGYFEKVVIADRAAVFVTQVYDNYTSYSGATFAAATVLFAVQVYCDFAGYSDIAIGASEVLGVKLMENFRQPYFATSLADFWSRWHISLSTWLGDYIFEPLVWSNWTARLPHFGRKKSGKPPVYSSLIITFIISGLWHGASWTYVVWGLLHGVLQVLGKMAKPLRRRTARALRLPVHSRGYRHFQQVLVFAMVCGAYVFFRASSLSAALYILKSIFTTFNPWVLFDGTLLRMGLGSGEWRVLLVCIAILWWTDIRHERGESLRAGLERCWRPVRWAAYCAIVLGITIFGVYGPQFNAARFIYFQF